MTDLSSVPTEELRAELGRRKHAAHVAYWEALAEKYPCSECGAPPQTITDEVVEEFRFAPKDAEGRPMIYASYESPNGTTEGVRVRITVTCENGHVTKKDDTRWFDEPRKGAPILPHRGIV